MILKPVEPRIKKLVDIFNLAGFETYGSCEGHWLFAGNAALPYIFFAAKENQKVRCFAKKLSIDQFSAHPQLFCAWQIEPFFNDKLVIVYRLTLLKPYRLWTRLLRSRIDRDFQTIGRLLQNLRNFHNQLDGIDLK